MTDSFGDRVVTADDRAHPEGFFDRFVFNLHPPPGESMRSVLLGCGVHPRAGVVDGFVLCVEQPQQRNLRFASDLGGLSREGWSRVGPFRWCVAEPMRRWLLRLDPNPSGVELDLEWVARAPAWTGRVDVANTGASATAFDHLFQSGRYAGTLRIDGAPVDVGGWYGQRDRSRGIRTMTGGQGLHLWVQAQFPDRSIGFLLVEDRRQERLLLAGAVMTEPGAVTPITEIRHDLRFTSDLDLLGGTVAVTTADGEVYEIGCNASAAGGYLAGGGYGGQHGRARGRDHVEHDVYPLDGTVTPRGLDTPLTDRLTEFSWNGVRGRGIFEFAHSRSRAYVYRATL